MSAHEIGVRAGSAARRGLAHCVRVSAAADLIVLLFALATHRPTLFAVAATFFAIDAIAVIVTRRKGTP